MLFIILALIIVMYIYLKISKKKIEKSDCSEIAKIILIPTLFYFIVVAIASPWIELRYIMPICGLMFIIVIYYLYKLLKTIFNEKISNITILLILITMLITPFIFKMEPEVLYSDKKEIVNKLENELNIPTVFFFNSNNNRFLDDILLFAKINESYIAKDLEISSDNIKEILQNKKTDKGVVIFINEGQENDYIINTLKDAIGLTKSEYLKRLNACDVYYVY